MTHAKRRARPDYDRARGLARLGLTADDYELLLAKQGGRCLLCNRPPKTRRLHVDHDHALKGRASVRGLICHFCNRFRVAGNTLETARRVVKYLLAFERRKIA